MGYEILLGVIYMISSYTRSSKNRRLFCEFEMPTYGGAMVLHIHESLLLESYTGIL